MSAVSDSAPQALTGAKVGASTPRENRRDTGYLFLPKRWRKARFLVWLRRTHAWLGLWGAVLGLLFGLSGFLLTHRAIMKIPVAEFAE